MKLQTSEEGGLVDRRSDILDRRPCAIRRAARIRNERQPAGQLVVPGSIGFGGLGSRFERFWDIDLEFLSCGDPSVVKPQPRYTAHTWGFC